MGGKPILGWQLLGLSEAGIEEVTLVTGFRAETIEAALPGITPKGLTVRTVFNPFFGVAENIGSCFLVRDLLRAGDTVLLNGDTLFEPAVLRHLLSAPAAPITVTIDRKSHYDADDMKVSADGASLRAIGKTLTPDETNGESIGMLRFQGTGGALFADGLEAVLRQPEGLRRWYLSVIHAIAQMGHQRSHQGGHQGGQVRVTSIQGLSWGEVDYPDDLAEAEALVRSWAMPAPALAG